jgi:hypothetical protein
MSRQPQNDGKSLPAIHWTKDYYPDYIKSSKKLNTKRKNNPINK